MPAIRSGFFQAFDDFSVTMIHYFFVIIEREIPTNGHFINALGKDVMPASHAYQIQNEQKIEKAKGDTHVNHRHLSATVAVITIVPYSETLRKRRFPLFN